MYMQRVVTADRCEPGITLLHIVEHRVAKSHATWQFFLTAWHFDNRSVPPSTILWHFANRTQAWMPSRVTLARCEPVLLYTCIKFDYFLMRWPKKLTVARWTIVASRKVVPWSVMHIFGKKVITELFAMTKMGDLGIHILEYDGWRFR